MCLWLYMGFLSLCYNYSQLGNFSALINFIAISDQGSYQNLKVGSGPNPLSKMKIKNRPILNVTIKYGRSQVGITMIKEN